MKLNPPGTWIAIAAAAAFAWGMAALFQDRLEAGDIYPAYSTLRSDPLGCRAFFTALERYPDLTVKRAFARGDFRGQKAGAAYLFLGLNAETMGEGEDLKELDSLARQGHRVILGFAPLAREDGGEYLIKSAGLWPGDTTSGRHARRVQAKAIADSTAKVKGNGKTPDSLGMHKTAAPDSGRYLNEWGLKIYLDTTFTGEKRGSASAQGNRKDTLPWVSGLYFDSLKGPWTVLYRRGHLPVAIERAVGSGFVVLISDSYFASNEAQLKSRPAVLAALILGASERIFFDERHFGVRQDDAVANLLRRYRLHWILPSLLLLLFCYLWKSRYALLPEAVPEGSGNETPASRSALAGLLRRNLTDRQALETCYGLWKESASRASGRGHRALETAGAAEGPQNPARRELETEISAALDRVKPAGKASLPAAYGGIQAILNRRNRK